AGNFFQRIAERAADLDGRIGIRFATGGNQSGRVLGAFAVHGCQKNPPGQRRERMDMLVESLSRKTPKIMAGLALGNSFCSAMRNASAPSALCAPSSRMVWPEAVWMRCIRPGQFTVSNPRRTASSEIGICADNVLTVANARAALSR